MRINNYLGANKARTIKQKKSAKRITSSKRLRFSKRIRSQPKVNYKYSRAD